MLRNAKIVATLGPASNSLSQISRLIEAGLDVARVNMSHGTYEAHTQLILNIREASKKVDKEVAILLDLQGPKIRLDKVEENLILKKGETWVIGQTKDMEKYPQYKDCYIPTIYDKLVEDCHDGARILFDDGLVAATAIERDGSVYKIEVTVGGVLKSNKGINLPDCDVSAPSFTAKDEADLMFGLKQGIDYIALSFVRKKEDIKKVKLLLHNLKMNIPIISKIEKPQALDNIEGILELTDAIMVARGDMGVEVGNHLVPSIQKKLIGRCNQLGIPVITATQMLESMIENPTPTRAEASDVANAIWDGTDAVMLSGESASGKYPLEAVSMMNQIIREAEKTPKVRPPLRDQNLTSVNGSLMVAASVVAEKIGAKRIIAVSESGHSCLKISQFRSQTPVVGVTSSINASRRMSLYWGVYPYYVANYDEYTFSFQNDVISEVKKQLSLKNGDKLVITRGDGKFFSTGSANSIKVEIIKDVISADDEDCLEEASDEKKRILLDHSVCGSCQNCINICPHDIWVMNAETKLTSINQSEIRHCQLDMECIRVCPTGAIEIIPNFG